MMHARLAMVGMLGLGLAGCASSAAERMKTQQTNTCNGRAVSQALATREMLQTIAPGLTARSQLGAYAKPVRVASLVRPNQSPLWVGFYALGVPGCPWMPQTGATYLPVVSQSEGAQTVLGYGVSTLQTLQRQGWEIAEATWPWQSYAYNYLPQR